MKRKERPSQLLLELFVESAFVMNGTKYGYGLTHEEVKALRNEANRLLGLNITKFHDALMGVTCRMGSEQEAVYYRHDVVKALVCGVQDRHLFSYEWD